MTLTTLREKAGLGLRAAARELEIDHGALHRYEAGTREIPPKLVRRMAVLYGVDPDDLCCALGIAPPDLVAALRDRETVRLVRGLLTEKES
jgi:transcriptional regulator with XRE-family HTH domain